MAEQQLPVFVVPQMHTVAFTVFIHLAIGTYSGLCPASVSEYGISIFPYITKIVAIDIALYEVVSQVWTRRYRAIGKYRGYIYAGTAGEKIISYLKFIFTEKSFTAIA